MEKSNTKIELIALRDGKPVVLSLQQLRQLLNEQPEDETKPPAAIEPPDAPKSPFQTKPYPIAGGPRARIGHVFRNGVRNILYLCNIDGRIRLIEVDTALGTGGRDAFVPRGRNVNFVKEESFAPFAKDALFSGGKESLPETLDYGLRMPADFIKPGGYRFRRYPDGAIYLDNTPGEDEAVPDYLDAYKMVPAEQPEPSSPGAGRKPAPPETRYEFGEHTGQRVVTPPLKP